MKNKYTCNLPEEIEAKYRELFIKRLNYTFEKSNEIKLLKNVFLSNTGTILHNFSIPINSAENLIGFVDKNFFLKRWKLAFEQYIVCKYGKSLKLHKCSDDEIYFSIHTPWFGYFSWITTYLPRLLHAIKEVPECILLFPEEWINIKFVKETMELIYPYKIHIIPKDHHSIIPQFNLIPCRKWTSHFDKQELLTVKNLFYEKLNINENEIPCKKIYISRKKAARRKITNEVELEIILKDQDFEIVCLEDLALTEQIKLLSKSSIIISSHGAGLTNINFVKKNSHVIELTPILSDFKKFRFPFWRMASLLELNYCCLFCDRTNLKTDEYESDIHINLKELSNLLEKII